jgi:cytochrome c556
MTPIARIAAGLLVLIFVGAAAYAKFDKPEDAIEYRQAAMHLIGYQLKQLEAVVKGDVAFEKEAFAQSAGVLKMLATLPWEAMMVTGTDKGETTMSAAVFEKAAEFKEAAAAFESATAQLAGAADLDAAKEQFFAVAGNCKGCHGKFRTR